MSTDMIDLIPFAPFALMAIMLATLATATMLCASVCGVVLVATKLSKRGRK